MRSFCPLYQKTWFPLPRMHWLYTNCCGIPKNRPGSWARFLSPQIQAVFNSISGTIDEFFLFIYFFPPTLAQLGMFRKAVQQFVRSCSSPAGAALLFFILILLRCLRITWGPATRRRGLVRLLEKEGTLGIGKSEQGKTLLWSFWVWAKILFLRKFIRLKMGSGKREL